MANQLNPENKEQSHEAACEGYGEITGTNGSFAPVSCCGSGAAKQIARVACHSQAESATPPAGANACISCGNPPSVTAPAPGEIVCNLGSGGGSDVFIAGQQVGPSGRAIGVEMTADMLTEARRNIAGYRERTGLDNVEFRLGEIEHLPVADASVDVVISDCTLTLSPDKPQVWREISRVLKPGGRVAISDMALLKPLPGEVLTMMDGSAAGAVSADHTRRMAEDAGLADIVLTSKPGDIDATIDLEDPLHRRIIAHFPAGVKISDYMTTLDVAARKGDQAQTRCGSQQHSQSSKIYNPAVAELVAIGAAIAANCEPCFKYHYGKALSHGVSREDMAKAVAMAQVVKEAPAKAIINLAGKYLECRATAQEAGAPPQGTCCGAAR